MRPLYYAGCGHMTPAIYHHNVRLCKSDTGKDRSAVCCWSRTHAEAACIVIEGQLCEGQYKFALSFASALNWICHASNQFIKNSNEVCADAKEHLIQIKRY